MLSLSDKGVNSLTIRLNIAQRLCTFLHHKASFECVSVCVTVLCKLCLWVPVCLSLQDVKHGISLAVSHHGDGE